MESYFKRAKAVPIEFLYTFSVKSLYILLRDQYIQ